TERIDFDEALNLLREHNPIYLETIERRYKYGENGFTNAEKIVLSRAVEDLTTWMNRVHLNRGNSYKEGPGTREVMTRSKAYAVVRNYYEGSYEDNPFVNR